MTEPLHGVLVVDKPAGMTSAAVVAQARRALGVERIGHTGTLDPMATGVLPLCLGEATKIAGHLLAEDKAYEAELELGVETDTLDRDGAVTRRDPAGAAAVTEDLLRQVVDGFAGVQEQIPPMYSALKHKGRRLHELARAGQVVERRPRTVTIHAIALGEVALPRARLFVHCSKGTYIRSLVADVGARLGCGAHLTGLRRVQSGAFTLAHAVALGQLSRDTAALRLIPPAAALTHLPAVEVPAHHVRAVASGQRLAWTQLAGPAPAPGADQVVQLVHAGALLALVRFEPDGSLRYERVFTYGLTKPAASSNLSGAPGRTPGRGTTPE